MAVPQIIQPSFAGGEVSPDVYSRVDIAKYQVALRIALNMFIRSQGGASNRAGKKFIAPVKVQGKRPRLIPFQFSVTQTYQIEVGDGYMRFIKDGGSVLEAAKTITGATQANPCVITSVAHGFSNGDTVFITGVAGMKRLNNRFFTVAGVTANTFQLQDAATGANINSTGYAAYTSGGTASRVYTISSPYLEADIPTLKFVQDADVMTITRNGYEIRELTRTGHTAWTLSTVTMAPALSPPASVTATATNVNPAVNISGITKANPAVVTTSSAHGVTNGQSIYITGVVGMTEVNGKFFIAANVTGTTLELQGVNSTGYGTWTSGGTVQRAKEIYRYVVTALATETLEESVASSNSGVPNDLTISTNYNTVTWAAVVGAEKYYVYRETNGSGIYGYVGSATSTTFVDQNIKPDESDTPPTARNPVTGAGKQPYCVTYHEQRRIFGGTDATPQTAYATQAGNYKNMNVSSPARDDDAWTFKIAAQQANVIRDMVSLNDLVVFTTGGEFIFKPGSDGDTITPSSIAVKNESRYGCSHLPPIVAGKTILFAESSQPTAAFDGGSNVRDMGYTFNTNDYSGNDLSILARHIFEFNTLREWAYASKPYGIVWAVRDDGTVAALTYLREHEVWAWHRHETDGDYESVSTCREDGEDAVYFVIKRVINGNTVRYIERMESRKYRNIEDAFFVDCGLTLDNYNTGSTTFTLSGGTNWTVDETLTLTASASTFVAGDVGRVVFIQLLDKKGIIQAVARMTVTAYTSATVVSVVPISLVPTALRGVASTKWAFAQTEIGPLDHLEGKTVSILADGNVEVQQVVTNGIITLPNPVAKAHVGLPYISDFQTLAIAGDVSKGSLIGVPLNVGKVSKGSLIGVPLNVGKVSIVVQETRGIFIGPNENKLYEVKQRQFENWAEPTRLKTGVVEAVCDASWADGSFLIRQSDPLPITILAVIPSVEVGAK